MVICASCNTNEYYESISINGRNKLIKQIDQNELILISYNLENPGKRFRNTMHFELYKKIDFDTSKINLSGDIKMSEGGFIQLEKNIDQDKSIILSYKANGRTHTSHINVEAEERSNRQSMRIYAGIQYEYDLKREKQETASGSRILVYDEDTSSVSVKNQRFYYTASGESDTIQIELIETNPISGFHGRVWLKEYVVDKLPNPELEVEINNDTCKFKLTGRVEGNKEYQCEYVKRPTITIIQEDNKSIIEGTWIESNTVLMSNTPEKESLIYLEAECTCPGDIDGRNIQRITKIYK